MSIWLLGVGLVLLCAGLLGAWLGAATVARHQARTAADLGALAGAVHVIDGQQLACTRAEQLVAANNAVLTDCQLMELDLLVTVEVTLPGGWSRPAIATARAGPLRADDSRLLASRAPAPLPEVG